MPALPPAVSRLVRRVAVVAASFAVAANALAFRHAWAFTHPSSDAARVDLRRLSVLDGVRLAVTGVPLPHPVNRASPHDVGLSFERGFVPAEAGRPSLESWIIPGTGDTTAVLFHGHGGTKSELLGHAAVFHALGLPVVMVDFPGAGGSGDAPATIGWEESTDVDRSVRYAIAVSRPRRIVLYGLSMGAVAAMKAMAEGTPADAAIVECPFDSLLTTVEHRFDTVHLPAFPAAHALLFWGGVQLGFDPFHHGALVYAPHVRQPVLLMSGERDPWVTVPETRRIFTALAGPKWLEICRGVGHASCLSRNPSRWTDTVRSFLATLPDASSKERLQRATQ